MGVLVGCLLGLLWGLSENRLVQAQTTIFFSPALMLPPHPDPSLPEGAPKGEQTQKPSPTAWAESMLTSKDAVDMVCKKIERSETEHKDAALRAACLLPEKRVKVESLPNLCLRLKVSAEKPELAVMLCQGLLAYLNFKTKIPLEDPDRERLTQVETQLRTQERNLAKTLWGQLAFDSPKTPDAEGAQAAELELSDYQLSASEYHQLMEKNFFRETWAAADNPFFTVIEPPFVGLPERPWWEFVVGGGFLGGVGGWLLERMGRRARRRQNVRWRSQEGPAMRRTGPSHG